MPKAGIGRRAFLRGAGGVMGAGAVMPGMAMGMETMPFGPVDPTRVTEEVLQAPAGAEAAPKYHVKFAVVGLSHDHIFGMVGAVIRGGGELVAVQGAEPERVAAFSKRFPQAKVVKTEDEILNDGSIQLVLTSAIPVDRAPLGVRVMRKGKDFLTDKPGVTTLEQLAEVRKTVAETKRIFAIMYSERLEVKAAVYAGELVKQGAIGRVIQTINIAPHQVVQKGGDGGGANARPWWFWDDSKFGGILCDIGSHQVDQFLYYTGSNEAEVVASQVANINHKDKPKFQDFGDMMLRGNKGFGYVRLDWFTPNGLGTWGDGRLFILGTEGYMELRKYVDVTRSKNGNNLFLVTGKEQRYIDCNNMPLPFGPQFVSDIVNRTHNAQDQAQCLLAAELVIKAQKNAKHVELQG
jgi:predicted dehydrogenase